MGILLYNLGQYDEALRELRTHRRISGSDDNLPLIADAERGRGRAQKALELFTESSEDRLGHDLYTELLMVAAGAHMDLGQVKEARALLETRNFAGNANGTLVRLLSVYSDVIRLQGDADLADRYEELARRTAKATGTLFGDEEVDPNEGVEIVTLTELELPEDIEGDTEDSDEAAEAAAGSETAEPSEAVASEPDESVPDAPEADAPEQAEASEQPKAADESEIADQAEAEERLREVDAEFDQETVDELDEILRASESEETAEAEVEETAENSATDDTEAGEAEVDDVENSAAAEADTEVPDTEVPDAEDSTDRAEDAEDDATEDPAEEPQEAPAQESPNRAAQDDEESDDEDDPADDEELTEPLFDL